MTCKENDLRYAHNRAETENQFEGWLGPICQLKYNENIKNNLWRRGSLARLSESLRKSGLIEGNKGRHRLLTWRRISRQRGAVTAALAPGATARPRAASCWHLAWRDLRESGNISEKRRGARRASVRNSDGNTGKISMARYVWWLSRR